MSFLRRIIESTHPYKKRKRNTRPDNDPSTEIPAMFIQPSPQFLNVPPVSRRSSVRSSRTTDRDDIDNFLSSDLELSFASTVSLHSPPRDNLALSEDSIVPMDISPAPAPRPTYISKGGDSKFSRPRAFTSAARLFGRDMSNNVASTPELAPPPVLKQEGSVNSSSKRTQRSALPMEWFNRPQVSNSVDKPSHAPLTIPPTSPGDAMDVDSDPIVSIPSATFAAMPHTAAPTVTTFNNFFFETVSPRRSFESPAKPQHKKRRSASPEPTRYSDVTSSPAPSSPSQAKLERMKSNTLLSRFNSKPTLEGLGAPSVNGLKRLRRPALSAMVQPSEAPVRSAYPDLGGDEPTEEDIPPPMLPPTRRAFSALLPPKGFGDFSSDEGSFDGPDMSSPAQAYAKRQHVKTIRRCDGTDDFRPLTGATAMVMRESPSARFTSAGLPGFGDNEAHGKVLPCHRVTDDGLMRITARTLDAVLDGAYDDKIHQFHVIDCRFDYEYNGGHIPGAINMNTTAAVEELLLGLSVFKPKPSISGDSQKKTVLIFHCEFSVKRAPTFAKHLRAKDRSMNNHIYPKIHYPEVYILEGGYCHYFKTSGPRCQPPAYVRMDDPDHANSRREDLDQFRKAKFGRHKSYTFGDGIKVVGPSQPAQPKRNTIPTSGPNSLFAAANAARTRRGGVSGLSTLAEDGDTTTQTDDEETDIGDSPCPPPNRAAASKLKKPLGRPLVRAETYGPTRMAYC